MSRPGFTSKLSQPMIARHQTLPRKADQHSVPTYLLTIDRRSCSQVTSTSSSRSPLFHRSQTETSRREEHTSGKTKHRSSVGCFSQQFNVAVLTADYNRQTDHASHQSGPPLHFRPRSRSSGYPSSGQASRLWCLSSRLRYSRCGLLLYCRFPSRDSARRRRRHRLGSTACCNFVQHRFRYLLWSLRYCVLDADAVRDDGGKGAWMMAKGRRSKR
jgi:hypothetical protein